MKLILRFADRLIFAAGVLLFLQLPNFADQYTQRFGGFYESEKQTLEEYRGLADKYFAGEMDLMIESFSDQKNNGAIREAGKMLANKAERINDLERGLQILEEGNLLERVAYIVLHFNKELFFGTINAYTPGMPFTTAALISGLIGGLIFSLIFSLLRKAFLLLLPKKSSSQKKKN